MLRPRRYRGLWLIPALAFCCRHGLAETSKGLRVVLEYSADAALGCPTSAELKASVSRQLGYDPFAVDGAEPRLRVEIVRIADRLEAQIEWIDRQQSGEGERRLAADDADCVALARSLAFAVAVQIQLHASAGEAPSAPPPPPPPSPPVAPAPAKPTSSDEDTPARRLVLLGVGALARHGLAPNVAPGLRVFGGLSKDWWAFELSAHATLPTHFHLADGSGFAAQELGANLAPCLRRAPFGVCAVGTISLLHVRGQGVDRTGSPSALTGGVGARLQLLLPSLERFGVSVQGEALAVVAPQDVFLNQRKVWSTAPVAFTAILDFAAIFP